MTGQQIVVISLEGVLQAQGTGAPILMGIGIYHALSMLYTTSVSLTDPGVDGRYTADALEWMRKEGLDKHQYGFASRRDYLRRHQLRQIRGKGHAVALWVDSDPETVADLSRQGVPTLLFTIPAYARPEHRPDYASEVKPWDDLVAEVEHGAQLRVNDTRLTA